MNNELNQYVKLVEFLGQVLGDNFEIVLQDVTDSKKKIVAIVNNFYNDRKDGSHLINEALEKEKIKNKDYICNYPGVTDSGKLMKSSILFIRNEQKETIGVLTINMKCDAFFKVQNIIDSLLRFNVEGIGDDDDSIVQQKDKVADPTLESIKIMVDGYGVDPERMTKNEKDELMCDLYDIGIFNLKGAVAETSEILKISEPSVYRYLSKIRRARE